MKAVARMQIRRGISDPALRRQVTPRDALGCKRVMLTDDWYPTLTRADVELVSDRDRDRHAGRHPRRRPSSARRRARPRHRLRGARRSSRRWRSKARRDARRGLGRRSARLPRRDRPRLPQPLPALRPQHQRRHGLGGGHDRVLDAPRAGRAGRAAPRRRLHDRGPPRGRRRLRRRAARRAEPHRLAHGLHELVRRRARQRPEPVALVMVGLPPPHGPPGPARTTRSP